MARRRLAVVFLAPQAEAAEIDALRRAVGLVEPFHVAPHVTLVPPTNVAEADVPAVLGILRRVAATSRPLELDVGPAATFLPETPTLHLAVTAADPEALSSLRGRLRCGPFDRPDVWPFHPHATIRESADPELIAAAVAALAGLTQRWSVASVHLLEQHRHGPDHPRHGQAHWVAIREEPLGGPAVVGRGGIELALRTVSMVEPDVAGLLGTDPTEPPSRPGPRPLVVVAEDPGTPGPVVGAAVGSAGNGSTTADLVNVGVVEDRRGEGIGRQLVNAWCSEAARQGAEVAVGPDHPYLVAVGFEPAAGVAVRSLGS